MRQQESIHHKNDQRHSRAIWRPSRIPPGAAGLNYKQQLEIQMTFSIKSKQNVPHWGPAMKHWCVINSMRWKRCIIISCMLAFILWWQDWQFMCGLQKVALDPFWKSFGQLFICMFLAKLVASGFWDPEYIKLDATSTSSPSSHVCLWGAINTCIWMMRRGVGMRWRSDRNLCFLKIAWPANLTSQVGTLNGSLCNCKCNLFSIHSGVALQETMTSADHRNALTPNCAFHACDASNVLISEKPANLYQKNVLFCSLDTLDYALKYILDYNFWSSLNFIMWSMITVKWKHGKGRWRVSFFNVEKLHCIGFQMKSFIDTFTQWSLSGLNSPQQNSDIIWIIWNRLHFCS